MMGARPKLERAAAATAAAATVRTDDSQRPLVLHLKMLERHSAVSTSTGQPCRPGSAIAPPLELSERAVASFVELGRCDGDWVSPRRSTNRPCTR